MTEETSTPFTPSWLRSKPNCCETCTSWARDPYTDHAGTCNNSESLIMPGEKTDSRYRCPSFKRKEGI